jgi:enamine deaminase RidA (YjgF/YER057c/UK114 family)
MSARVESSASPVPPAPACPVVVTPAGWAAPLGYSHGMTAAGRVIVTAGQIGWDPAVENFYTDDFVEQTAQALKNVVTVLRAAGAGPEHLVRLTWFIVDREEYVHARPALGKVYREIVGRYYPAMSVVFVNQLLEERARLEIEATAVVPE